MNKDKTLVGLVSLLVLLTATPTQASPVNDAPDLVDAIVMDPDDALDSYTSSSTPQIHSISSTTHPDQTKWYDEQTATLKVHSSTNKISWSTTGTPDCTQDSSTYTWSGGAYVHTVSYSQSWGSMTFQARALDTSTGCSAPTAFITNHDTINPVITERSPPPGTTTRDVLQTLRVEYNDDDNGLDSFKQTTVDVAQVQLLVNGIDRTDQITTVITERFLEYTPLTAWAIGAHDIVVRIRDTSVGADLVQASWTFFVDPTDHDGDQDQDKVPDSGEGAICGHENQGTSIEGDCPAEDNYRPPADHGDVVTPANPLLRPTFS